MKKEIIIMLNDAQSKHNDICIKERDNSTIEYAKHFYISLGLQEAISIIDKIIICQENSSYEMCICGKKTSDECLEKCIHLEGK